MRKDEIYWPAVVYDIVNWTVCSVIVVLAIAVLWFAGGAFGGYMADEAKRSCPVELVECD